MVRNDFTRVAVGLSCVSLLLWTAPATRAQGAAGRRVRIATMFNASPDNRLFTFLSGNCEGDNSNTRMRCAFHRASLLPPSNAEDNTCSVSTAGFERVFRKETESRWISERDAAAYCDTVLTLLHSNVANNWDMKVHITTPAKVGDAACQGPARDETFSWAAGRSELPCRFVRPAAE
jgi:hypothetical protein